MIQILNKASRLVQRLPLVAMVVSLAALPVSSASGAPETWFEPAASLIGTEVGARLGEALSCSNPVGGAQGESFIAAAAPDEDSGKGAVYIYRLSTSTSNPVQRLTSGAPGAGKRFGASVVFFKDVNGDGVDELAIGEPNPSGASGKVWLYFSQAGAEPYQYCNVHLGAQQWGQTIASLRAFRAAEAVGTLVIGTPTTNRVRSLTVSFSGQSGPGVCDVAMDGFFDAIGSDQSGFGASMAEGPFISAVLSTGLVIGAPYFENLKGRVSIVGSSGQDYLVESGNAGDLLGVSVAARATSDLAAYAAINAGMLDVKKFTASLITPVVNYCSVPINATQLGTQGIAHLGTAFSSFLGDGNLSNTTFAVYRAESGTGGSLSMFAALPGGICTEQKTLNNCVLDANQDQARSIIGGTGCVTSLLGSAKPMLLVSSPGASGDKGRVDIILEGTERQSPKSCQGNGDLGNPTQQTPTPTSTPIPDDPQGSSGSLILFQPGQGGLPAAVISKQQGADVVDIKLPEVRLKSRDGLRRIVSRRWNLSQGASHKLIRRGFSKFYQLTLITDQPKRAGIRAKLADILVSPASADTNRKTRTIRTRNRITSVRLAQGAALSVTWRAGIRFRNSNRVLLTKASPESTFISLGSIPAF